MRSLIAFEATARLGSMTTAAHEEGTTQPAISQRIRVLEDQAGLALFNRRGGKLELTEHGEVFYRDITPALAQIRCAMDQLQRSVQESLPVINIAAGAGFIHVWLLPRLDELKQAFPGHVFKLIPVDRDEAPEMQQADISIRFGSRNLNQEDEIPVATEDVFPVCSPDYAADYGLGPELTSKSLKEISLLHLDIRDDRWLDWQEWCRLARIDRPSLVGIFTYNNYPLLVNAALNHQGVALGWSTVIKDYLESGQLVALGPHVTRNNYGYKLYVKHYRSAVLRPITDWLIDEFCN